MKRFALIGCGRIGTLHAEVITAHPGASLDTVYDPNADAARAIADANGARVAGSANDAITSEATDAVLIASATATHADLIESAVAAGKPVFCEKPIDLDLQRVRQCRAAVANADVPVQIGFNRRFDPGHRAVRDRAQSGEIGDVFQVIITSRDPAPPPRAYVAQSGGLFRDMTIHDFDLARFMLGEDIAAVQAIGAALINPALATDLGDIDTAMVTLETASGRQCQINNSRQAAYGYDQRVEVLGRDGMLISANRTETGVEAYSATTTAAAAPYLNFFLERYRTAFDRQFDAFLALIEGRADCEATFADGEAALVLAECANMALHERRSVAVEEIADRSE
ncbi:MAG: inositol 2-dehydrogenase [Pseudomonadota bacterium]